ncbi:unnamed protein product [Candidula unifasciata]|uniref:Gastrin/cholecystokinin type B receptor n=1 Tax=Candidula unifasciata TaxID=100452 RepID=A0A8S4A2T6_9EUPU|nr:unnamed protein product [Candidula unifasciata]
MEFCRHFYNQFNDSLRGFDHRTSNTTWSQYVQMCNSTRRGNISQVNDFIILPYLLIFLLSVVGNTLVILTLVRHKKMRTVTNMFLLNLAISDLLLAVFCMPFTLIPMMMERFIFGPVVCKLIRYAQAVSVGVSCATLVAISIERFYAICQPLKSRRWQTLSHSYKVILAIWLVFATLMVPIAVFNKLLELNNGAYACREIWPIHVMECLYTILLDIVLLVLPLFLMGYSYGRISKDLWSEVSLTAGSEPSDVVEKQNGYTSPQNKSPLLPRRQIARSISTESSSGKCQLEVLRPAYYCRVLANKKRVVKMLCVVVLEYFICWTPLFVLNSWTVLNYVSARENITPLLKTIILLLSYLSSCIHPITYCFMNRRFRQSFADVFRCCFRKKLSSAFFSVATGVSDRADTLNTRQSPRHVKITWKRKS